MTHKYILRNASAVSIVLEYRFPSNRNYGFLHIVTSVSIPWNEGVKLSGILNRATAVLPQMAPPHLFYSTPQFSPEDYVVSRVICYFFS